MLDTPSRIADRPSSQIANRKAALMLGARCSCSLPQGISLSLFLFDSFSLSLSLSLSEFEMKTTK